MIRLFGAHDPVGRFRRDRHGSILVAFCMLSVGLVVFAGAAVDYTLAVQFRGALQDAADDAALAGAANFFDAASFRAHRAVAANFMTASIARLPTNNGVTFAVTPFATITDGNTTAYNIKVTASGQVKTTFLSLVVDSIPVSVAATATSPVAAGSGEDFADARPSDGEESSSGLAPLYDRGRNLDLEAFGMGLASVHLVQ